MRLEAYILETEDPGRFLYIPTREHLGREELDEPRPMGYAEPIKMLSDMVKVEHRGDQRPSSQASTALTSRL